MYVKFQKGYYGQEPELGVPVDVFLREQDGVLQFLKSNSKVQLVTLDRVEVLEKELKSVREELRKIGQKIKDEDGDYFSRRIAEIEEHRWNGYDTFYYIGEDLVEEDTQIDDQKRL